MMRSVAVALLLLTSTAAVAAAEPKKADEHEKAADPGDKMICKRFTETGSLVKGYRTCKTKRDWEREREALRAGAGNINSCAKQGTLGTC